MVDFKEESFFYCLLCYHALLVGNGKTNGMFRRGLGDQNHRYLQKRRNEGNDKNKKEEKHFSISNVSL